MFKGTLLLALALGRLPAVLAGWSEQCDVQSQHDCSAEADGSKVNVCVKNEAGTRFTRCTRTDAIQGLWSGDTFSYNGNQLEILHCGECFCFNEEMLLYYSWTNGLTT